MKNILFENKEKFVAVVVVMVFLMTCSFAWLVIRLNGQKPHILRAGTLELSLDDNASSGILIKKAIPVSDTKGLSGDYYEFNLKNTGATDVYYNIYLDDNNLESNETRMEDRFVKYSISKNDSDDMIGLVSSLGVNPNRILESGKLLAGNTNNYKMRVWINSDATNDVMGTIFYTKLRVEVSQNNPLDEDSNS